MYNLGRWIETAIPSQVVNLHVYVGKRVIEMAT
jgi:hypothetical protein